ASMPLRVWRTDEVAPLSPHPNDPPPTPTSSAVTATEFLVTFTLAVPLGTADQTVEDTKAREAQAAHDLAGQGHLLRLWTRPDGRPVRFEAWRLRKSTRMLRGTAGPHRPQPHVNGTADA